MLSPEQRVGSFVLLEKLGAGGIGEVWKARDHRLNRIVALKFILSDDHKSVADLTREARSASALNHPNIVTILEIGESDSGTYIAMEFVEGETLRSRLARSRIPFAEALDILTQMARGLAAAHQNGIVHRDIKPDNVMLRIDGYIKLVDFGLAKRLPWTDNDEATNQSISSDISRSGQIVGTFSYMSPEQSRGQRVEPSSDVFSFGIILYEILTGGHPFRAGTPMDTLARIIGSEPVSTRVRCPELPEELHAIVDRCLNKDPSKRFQSGSDLDSSLRAVKGAPPARRRFSWKPVVALTVIAIVLAVAAVVMRPQRHPTEVTLSVRSVAVRNFKAAAEDTVSTVLAQGISEDLGGALSRQGFLVAPRSRVLALPEAADAVSVGDALQVDAVLEGNITSVEETVRIYVELVSTRTGFQIWSDSITANRTDLMSNASDAAADLATQIRSVVHGNSNSPAAPAASDVQKEK